MIDDALLNTSVTVVCIGSRTSERKFIRYEIERSEERGNGLLGIQINHLKGMTGEIDPPGATPAQLIAAGATVTRYTDGAALKQLIEAAAKAAGK